MRAIFTILIILVLAMTSCTAPAPDQANDEQADLEQVQKEKEELEQKLKEIEEQSTTVEKAEETQEEATVVVEQKEEESASKEVPPSPVEQKVTVIESSEISAETKELLGRADKKIKSYSYTLAPPPDQLARDKWYVKGTKIKVELYNDNYVEPDTYFDTIHLDSETKQATGYCLSQRTTRCAEPGQRFDLDYADTYEKTPYQWLKEISGTPKIISSEVVYDRRVSVVEYKKGGDTYKQWIDQFSGLPIRIEKNGERTSQWEFRYLAINNVLDSDVKEP